MRGMPFRICLLACLATTAGLGPSPAAAWPQERGAAPRQARHARRAPPQPAAIVSGYLPRNNAVPMYNEPPRFR